MASDGVVRVGNSDYVQGRKKRFTLVMKQARFGNNNLPTLYQVNEHQESASDLMVRGASQKTNQVSVGVQQFRDARSRQKLFL